MQTHANMPTAAHESDALRAEKIQSLYASFPISLAANMIIALILVGVQWGTIATTAILGWLALLIFVLTARTLLFVAYRRIQGDADNNWLPSFRAGIAATGVVWGLASFLLYPVNDVPHQTFLAFALAGMTAGAITTLSIDLVSVLAFTLPALTALILRLFAEGEEIPIAMGTMTTLFLLLTILIAQRTHRHLRESVTLRFIGNSREQLLRESEERLNQAQRVARLGSFEWNPISGELTWSDEHFRLWGLEPHSVTPNYEIFRQRIHPDDVMRLEETVRSALDGGRIYDCVHRIVWPDGSMYHIHGRGEVVFNTAGQAIRMHGTVLDITEQKLADDKRQETLDRLHKIASRVPGVVYEFRRRPDGSSCIPFASDAIRDIFRINPEDVREDSAKAFAVIHPDDLDDIMVSIQVSAQRLAPWRREFRIKFDDGTVRWLFGNALPQQEPDGSVLWHGFITDITEHKQTDEALHRTTQLLDSIVDHIPAMVFLKRADDLRFELFNRAGEMLLGYSRNDLIGKNDYDFFPKDQADAFTAEDRRVLASTEVTEILQEPIKTASGETRYLYTKKVALRDKTGATTHLLGISLDITDRKQAEEALQESVKHTQAILDNAVDGIITIDIEGIIKSFNRAAERIFGYVAAEVIGKNINMLMPEPYHSRHDGYLENYYTSGMAPIICFSREVRGLRKDGSTFPMDLAVSDVNHHDKHLFIGLIRDITDSKKTEVEHLRLQQQVAQSQKMEAIGQLTGGVAHDFNNMLSGILGYTELAQETARELGDKTLYGYLDEVIHAGKRARDLVIKMLAFGRSRATTTPQPILLSSVIPEMLTLLRPLIPSSVTIRTELDASVPPVSLDSIELQQILMNLCINGRDAMDGMGTLVITVRKVSLRDATCTSCHIKFSGDCVELLVSDTGYGMNHATLQRVFEPFFTTKEVGKGSGMGMAVVHGIVHDRSGHILVESQLNKGSCFRLLFTPHIPE